MKLERAPKVIAFDAFETIVHFTPTANTHGVGAYHTLFRAGNMPANERNQRRNLAMTKNETREDICTYVSNAFTKIETVRLQELRELLDNELASMQFYNDTIPTLLKLAARGYPLSIASNLAQPYGVELRNMIHQDATLRHIIDQQRSAFSYEVWSTKPDKPLFQHIADAHGVDLIDILMIGNHPTNDVLGPREHWLQSILLDRKDIYKNWGTDNKIRTLSELLDIL